VSWKLGIEGLVRSSARDAENWRVGTSGTILARRDVARMVFGEVGLGAHGAGQERSGASGGGVAIELTLAAASAWAEQDVLLKGAAAVGEVELAAPVALGGLLTNDSQHNRGRIFAGSLLSAGEPSRGLAQAHLRVEHLYLPANLIEGGGGGDIAEDKPGPLLADASASDRNFSLPQRLLQDTQVRRVFGGAVAVGNDDDEGVRSGDRSSEAGGGGRRPDAR
jgi:hypothetical protein